MPHHSDGGRAARWLGVGLPVLLVAAPLPFAGRTPAASAALCAAAAGLCAAALPSLARRRGAEEIGPVPAALPLAALLLLACAQLVPLPFGVVSTLSPAAARLRAAAAPDGAPAYAPLSLAVTATLAAIGRWSAALAVFVAACVLSRSPSGARRIALGLCLAGTVQGVYGLFEFLAGHHRIFTYTREAWLGRLSGTYINPNHLAGLMELALPATLGLILSQGPPGSSSDLSPRRHRRGRIAAALSDPGKGRARLLLAAAAVMALAVLFTRSRAGIALIGGACVAVLLAGARLSRTAGGVPATARSAARRAGWALALTLLAVVSIAPLASDQASRMAGLYRAAPTDFLEPGGRAEVWSQTLRIVRDHPLAGVGLGGFAGAFPRYRGPSVSLRWQEAHNDPLQLLAETGIAGGVLALLALAALAVALRRSLAPAPPHTAPGGDRVLRGALACGCAALALHETIDFNLQVPANAVAFAAALAACLVVPAPAAPRPVPSGAWGGRTSAVLLAVAVTAGSLWGVVYPESASARRVGEAREMLVAADAAAAGIAVSEHDAGELARSVDRLLRETIRDDPAHADAHLLLARLERRATALGWPVSVVPSRTGARLALASRLDPFRPDLHLGLLRERVARRERGAALDEIRALAVRGGEPLRAALPAVWSLLSPDAGALERSVDEGRAAAPMGRAALSPDADAWIVLAEFFLRAGRADRAERRLAGMLAAPPSLAAAAYGRLAPVMLARGDAPGLIRLGEDLLVREDLAPADAAAVRCALARGHLSDGSTARAVDLAREAVGLAPRAPAIRRRAAELFLEAGEAGPAAREFEHLLRGGAPDWFLLSEERRLRRGLARAYDRMRRRDDALRQWREVARLDPADREARERIVSLSHGL